MAKIIDHPFDPIHLTRGSSGFLKLTIGTEGRKGNRNHVLDAKDTRILAYALLFEAERLKETKKSD